MKRICITLLILISSVSCFSQEPEEHINIFFNIYQSKNINIALDSLFSTNPWLMERSKDNIDNIKSQLASYSNILGKYKGFELIMSKKIGGCLQQYTYIVKFDRQPLRFNFIFYRASDIWGLQNFRYDDNLSEELYESSKIYYLEDKNF